MIVSAPEFTADWFTPNIPTLAPLLEEHRGKPVHYLEIGAFEGRSTLWFLENILTNERSQITVIDTFEGSPEHLDMGIVADGMYEVFRRNTYDYRRKIQVMKARSQYILPKLYAEYDFVYVDGSHDQKDVLIDVIYGFRLLADGGIMVCDDYEYDNPQFGHRPAVAIDAFLKVYDGCYVELSRGYQIAIRKQRRLPQ